MQLLFDTKVIKCSILILFLIELVSFLGYFFDFINTTLFFLILFIALILSLIKLEYGLYIIMAELFIGSSGYLFSLDYQGFSVSLRIGLFLVIFAVWLVKAIKNKQLEFRKFNLFWWYLLLILFLGWGLLRGCLGGHNFSDIFFDLNAYLFFALIFVFFEAIQSWQQIKIILEIMLASIIILAVKALFYYLIYAANLKFFSIDLYHWQRSTEGGQLAHLGHNLYRILFLSDIYPLMAIFIFGVIMVYLKNKKIELDKFSIKLTWLAVILSSLTVVISFFRSYWASLVLTLIIGIFFVILKLKIKKKTVIITALILMLLLVAEIVGLYGVSQGLQKFVAKEEVLTQKDIFASDDPGIVGRLALLQPLWYKFLENPLMGHGFGTTISFLSTDPRHYNRQYITYAFEWGYFDIAIKIGLLGLFVYLGFIFVIFKNGLKLLNQLEASAKALIAGLLLGLVVLVLTHGVSPYLNHPLGIGYLMLVAAVFHALKQNKNQLLST